MAEQTVCRECRNDMPPGARKCTQCSSYQDWRRFVFTWSGLLTATLALLPLWTGAYSLWNLAFLEPAKLDAAIATCRSDKLLAFVGNKGQVPAMLGEPHVEFADGDSWVPFEATFAMDEDKLVIDPGEVDVVDLAPPEGGSYPPDGLKPCKLKIVFPVLDKDSISNTSEATCTCVELSGQ
jgi:hypothetical protein